MDEVKKDVVVGCITGYNFDKIRPWVNSLDRSGFTGDKVMLCYNVDYNTVRELEKRNYIILAFKKNDELKRLEYPSDNLSIVVDRFYHIWHFLREQCGKYRYIISTDVKDVVFQSNPSVWLENNLGEKEINAACESIHYKNEQWGNHNLYKSFGPLIYGANKDNLIFNAGTLSGKFDTMMDFFLNVFLSCGGAPRFVEGGGGPDQAAVNILLNLEPYKNITRFTMSEEGWAAQLGTTGPSGPRISHTYKDNLVEPSPLFDGTGLVTTSTGEPFVIVHQYDRIEEWKKLIEERYAD